MSRVGRKPVPIPAGVRIEVGTEEIVVSGPKGSLRQPLLPRITVTVRDGQVYVERRSDEKADRERHGLMRSLLANMITGVTEGYRKELQIIGLGYRADIDGGDLVLSVGYSHPVRIVPPEGISFEVAGRNDVIVVSGIDKVLVGQQAADIRAVRRPEPYKGKGIRYMGEVVRHKAGKAGKV